MVEFRGSERFSGLHSDLLINCCPRFDFLEVGGAEMRGSPGCFRGDAHTARVPPS